MQKYTRQKRIALGVETAEEYIQFRLYKVFFFINFHSVKIKTYKVIHSYCHKTNRSNESNQAIRNSDLERINSSGAYTNKREVSTRFSLNPGTYVIIPSCYDENVEGEFLLRIFTEKPLIRECKYIEIKN